jgi:hypothetical protein
LFILKEGVLPDFRKVSGRFGALERSIAKKFEKQNTEQAINELIDKANLGFKKAETYKDEILDESITFALVDLWSV